MIIGRSSPRNYRGLSEFTGKGRALVHTAPTSDSATWYHACCPRAPPWEQTGAIRDLHAGRLELHAHHIARLRKVANCTIAHQFVQIAPSCAPNWVLTSRPERRCALEKAMTPSSARSSNLETRAKICMCQFTLRLPGVCDACHNLAVVTRVHVPQHHALAADA